MPSEVKLPDVDDLLTAYEAGSKERDKRNDTRAGSLYDLFGGIGALVFARLAQRDRAIFRALYFDFSEADDLDRILQERFGTSLGRPTPGTGRAWLSRPSAAAGAGTFYHGTRFSVLPAGVSFPVVYVVDGDQTVNTSSTSVQLDVVAEQPGKGSAIDTRRGRVHGLRIEDALWDATWKLDRIIAGEGTGQEQPEAARARVRKDRFDSRVGYAKGITDALAAAGATQVALFPSDFTASNPVSGIESIGTLDEDGYGDTGLNRAFVGDAGFQATPALLKSCRLAMDKWAIAGSALQVWGMVPQLVTFTISIRLWQDPGRTYVAGAIASARAAVKNYFDTRKNPFHFRVPAIRGAIQRAVVGVQQIAITASPIEPTLTTLFNTVPIKRFYVTDGSINVTILGPAA